jgi:localization factor PodJL
LQQIDDLSRQISQFQNAIIHRLDNTHTPVVNLSGLEIEIGRLSEKIDQVARPSHVSQTPQSNRDLVKESAQLAAQQVLQEVQNQSASLSPTPLVKDLKQLRQQQVTDTQLTQENLAAVHNRLEKVVDRISHLEQELGDSLQAAPQVQGQSLGKPKKSSDQPVRRPNAMPADAFEERDPLARSQDFTTPKKVKARNQDIPWLTKGLPDIAIEPGSRLESLYSSLPQFEHADSDNNEQMFAGDPSRHQSSQAQFIHAARRAAQLNAKIPRLDESDTEGSGDFMDKAMAAARARARAAAAAVTGDDEYEKFNQSRPNVSGLMSNPMMRKSMVVAACLLIAFGSLQLVKLVQSGSSPGSHYEPPILSSVPSAAPDPISSTSAEATKANPKQESVGGNTLIFAPDASKSDGQANKMGRQSGLVNQANDRFSVGAINPVTSQAPEPLSAEDAQKLGQLREAAQRGQADPQYQLADRLNEGRGLPRDLKQAALWYERAAIQDLPLAQYKLGLVYEKGLGVEKDLVKAKNWYAKAAERGNIKAMHNLAVLLADGGDGAPDYASAKKWFQKAAENGVRDSQFNLAVLNARGLGGALDAQSAYVWFAIVALQGDSEASKKRDELSARLSADQLKAAQSTIAAFKPRTPIASANEGEPVRAQTHPQAQTQTTKAAAPTDKQSAVQTPAFTQPKITLKAKI